jgi:hypothetical protein
VTVSVVREALGRVLTLAVLTLAGIVQEMNATLRRKEEARIYAWVALTGEYPPRRGQPREPTARIVLVEQTTGPPSDDGGLTQTEQHLQ